MRTILLAGGLSLLLTLLLTPQFIKFLTRRQYGQFIRDDGPKEHLTKRGTPTMGGVVIVASVTLPPHLLGAGDHIRGPARRGDDRPRAPGFP